MPLRTKPGIGQILTKGSNFVNPMDVVEGLVKSYTEYKNVKRQEKTKIRNIEAWERVTLAEIAAKRDLFLAYITESFAERARLFEKLFCQADTALQKSDAKELALILTGITELAKSTPFKGLMDLNRTKELLRDPNHEWKL